MDYAQDYKNQVYSMKMNLDQSFSIPSPPNDIEKISSSTMTELKIVNSITKDEEINYKNCDFKYLISNMETKVLERCFCKILSFLESASVELEFRNISKILEEILIRIVKDVNVLKTDEMFNNCKAVCRNIVKKVNMYNSGIYFLACIFKQEAQNSLYAGLGGNSKNILVYKKVYITSLPQSFSSNSSRSPSSHSRSSSLDSEDSIPINQHNSSPHQLTDYFKSHSLNLILKFVKDKSQTSLVFSGLTAEKATFVHSVFSSFLSDSCDDAVKKICPHLWEALKIFGLKYVFSVKYLQSGTDKKFLLLEKEQKHNASVLTEYFDFQTALSVPTSGKALRKHKDTIKCLPPDLIIKSLKKLSQFFKDESEGSLIFSNVTSRDARFLKNIINYCRSAKIKSLFSKEAQQLLDEIQISDATKTNFKLKIKQENVGAGEKNIRFLKMPVYEKRAPQTRQWYPCVEVFKGSPKEESNVKLKRLDAGVGITETKQRVLPTRNLILNYGKSLANINFQYAGDMSNERRDESSFVLESEKDVELVKAMERHSLPAIEPLESMIPTPARSGRGKGFKRVREKKVGTSRQPRKTQLIEALSVPVKSDKALKMMLGMGWKGGALGSRGDGITEPIMPDLNTVAGAGLGHFSMAKPNMHLPKGPPAIPTLSVSCNKRSASKFREQFLGQLLELLHSSDDVKTVRFHKMLNKKEISFIKHAMRSFAMRIRLQMTDDEQNLVDKILVQYEKDPELMVFVCISDDKKEVHFRKIHTVINLVNRKDNVMPEEITDNDLYFDNIELILDGFGPLCQSQRSYKSAKFRMTILVQLLKFIKNDSQNEIEVKFENELNSKQRNNIEKSICSINKRTKFGASGGEMAMSREIKRNMGNFNLNLKFSPDFKSFNVTKQYVNKFHREIKTATFASINNRKSKRIQEIDNKGEENEDLYMEDDIKITDNAPRSRHKLNQIVYKNREISEIDDQYASELSEDFKNSVNYPESGSDIFENRNTDVPRNDEEIVVEYDDSINEKDTKSLGKSSQNTICEGIMSSNNICRTKEPENSNRRKFEEHAGNLINSDISELTSMSAEINQLTSISAEMNRITTAAYETTPIITIDSDSNTSLNNSLSNVVDKMSISDQSQPDYSVLGLEDITMSDDKLTDWDGTQSDDSDNFSKDINIKDNLIVNRVAEFKKKLIKKKINKAKTDIRVVSLNKKFVLPENLVKHIQRIISYNIIKTEKFPKLKCYGVHKGVLIYSCQDKKSYDWLLDMCVANEIILLDEVFDTMSFKINWFYDVNDNYVFDMLDLYNKNISTNDWSILKKEEVDDNMIYVVKMDKESFKFILESDLSLYAGVDKIQFSIVWE